MSERGQFEHAVRVTHHGRSCARCTQFYTEHGVVHPIRNSPGYDPSVEDVERSNREHRRLAHLYGHERQERHASVVERPPWAAGISEKNLLTIARAHGTNAAKPGWWEEAGLVGAQTQNVGGRTYRYKQSGELREAIREVKGTSSHAMTARRVTTRRETPRAAGVHVFKPGGEDLPF